MKTVNARDLEKIRECVDLSQQDKVVITRHGRPAASSVFLEVDGREAEGA